MGWEGGAVTLGEDEELDEVDEADGEVKAERPGLILGAEFIAESEAGRFDLRAKGGCGG